MMEELRNKIEELEARINQIEDVGAINDAPLLDKGFLQSDKPGTPSSTYTTDSGFRRNIDLSGAPETIIVPAYPYKFLKLRQPPNFYVPVYTFNSLQT